MRAGKVRVYDKEFKLNAVKLYLKSGCGFKQTATELGIPFSTLIGWVELYKKRGKEAFPGKGHIHESDSEVVNLRKKLAIVSEERDILKKALGIFSSARK